MRLVCLNILSVCTRADLRAAHGISAPSMFVRSHPQGAFVTGKVKEGKERLA